MADARVEWWDDPFWKRQMTAWRRAGKTKAMDTAAMYLESRGRVVYRVAPPPRATAYPPTQGIDGDTLIQYAEEDMKWGWGLPHQTPRPRTQPLPNGDLYSDD